ncbi:response regulator [Thalassotalea marina]|uniref:Two-component system response regulator n=1 Tax=Thalassotalea marina TaxID=1673741 RepID=A0A919BNW6_9GAMM|nr:response regulator [Thalassotalea marina]GHG03384.1 two-component system response regulator [Thalassotalea marina]
MRPSVLVVDDEPQIIKSLERVLGREFSLHVFTSPVKALAFFRLHPTHIVVSDMKMPDMSGEDFLTQIKRLSPETKCCVLTGYADSEAAQKAINKANISAYFTKPWVNHELKQKLFQLSFELLASQKRERKVMFLEKNIERYEMDRQIIMGVLQNILNEQYESQHTLYRHNDMNKQLLHLLAILTANQSGESANQQLRVANYGKALAHELSLSDTEVTHIYIAILFYQIGLIGGRHEELDKPIDKYTREDEVLRLKLNDASVELLASVDVLKPCAELIQQLFVHWCNQLDKKDVKSISLAAKVIRHVVFFDYAIRGKLTGQVMSVERAIILLKNKVVDGFELFLLDKLEGIFRDNCPYSIESPKLVQQLRADMVLSEDLLNSSGQLLLGQGEKLTNKSIEQLLLLEENIEQPLIVFVQNNSKGVLK